MATQKVEITRDGETALVSPSSVRVWLKSGWTLAGDQPVAAPTLFDEEVSEESETNSSGETDEAESDVNHQAADPEEN